MDMNDYKVVQGEPVEAPGAITAGMLEAIWRDGFDAENYDDQAYCQPLIIARIAVEEAQPAPDVAGLVEALVMARGTIAAALRANAPDWFGTDEDVARHVSIKQIDAVIAASQPALAQGFNTGLNSDERPDPDVEGLAQALEACRDDLRWMIERHNQQDQSDGSWLYDYQTVEEADAALAAYRKGARP